MQLQNVLVGLVGAAVVALRNNQQWVYEYYADQKRRTFTLVETVTYVKDGFKGFPGNIVLSIITGPHVFWIEYILIGDHLNGVEDIVTVRHVEFVSLYHEHASI